jgi:integrase
MATITEHKNGDGSRSFTAQVRIKPFNASSKTFHERDFPARKDAKKAAESWAGELEKTLREQKGRGGIRQDVASLSLRKLADEYLADPETKALATYDERERQIAWWVNRYGATKTLEFPSPILLREARDALAAEGYEPGTVNRYLAAARAMVNFGRASGLLPPNLVWPPRLMLTEPKARERFLNDAELGRVLEEARAKSVLMYASVMFAIGVGCRQSEQLRVRWGDIDEKSGTVAIRVTKTNTSRRAHMPAAVLGALKELRGKKVAPMPMRYVFVDETGEPLKAHVLIDLWEKVREAAKVEDVRWHDLRHASASFLIQGGATLAEVAHQLGHLNVATAKRYAHLVPGAKPTGADKLNEKLGGRK